MLRCTCLDGWTRGRRARARNLTNAALTFADRDTADISVWRDWFFAIDGDDPPGFAPALFSPLADWRAVQDGEGFGTLANGPTRATVTRTGTGKTCELLAEGKIVDVPADALPVRPRADGHPGFEALACEAARTNLLPNTQPSIWSANTPDGWTVTPTGSPELTQARDSGLRGPETAHRLSGTASGASSVAVHRNTATGTFAAGESAAVSAYVRAPVLAPGATYEVIATAYDAAHASLGAAVLAAVSSPHSGWRRFEVVYPSLPANTSYVRLTLAVSLPNGAAYDISWACAQVEKAGQASSYIPTTTTTATRNADTCTIPTTGWSRSAFTWGVVATMRTHTLIHSRSLDWGISASGNRVTAYNEVSTRRMMFETYDNSVAAQAIVNPVTRDATAAYVLRAADGQTHGVDAYSERSFVGGPSPTQTKGADATAMGVAYVGADWQGALGLFGSWISRITIHNTRLSRDNGDILARSLWEGHFGPVTATRQQVSPMSGALIGGFL